MCTLLRKNMLLVPIQQLFCSVVLVYYSSTENIIEHLQISLYTASCEVQIALTDIFRCSTLIPSCKNVLCTRPRTCLPADKLGNKNASYRTRRTVITQGRSETLLSCHFETVFFKIQHQNFVQYALHVIYASLCYSVVLLL